jgi:biopolymer transport protein ExbB/TolQ
MSFRAFSLVLWIFSVGCMVTIAAVIAFSHDGVGDLPLLGNMLQRPHLVDSATPIAILVLFAWVLIELAARARRVIRERKAVHEFAQQIQHGNLGLSRIESKFDPQALRAPHRAYAIVQGNLRDPASLHETLPGMAALDAETLAANYGALNVYAWILPVLGFIGTASGMASAIDGFKNALRGGTGQVETLSTQLSQTVIPGLTAAFGTTILALAASLVAYLCTSAIKSWDQEALQQLDRLCVEFLARIPRVLPGQDADASGLLRGISERVDQVVQLLDVIKGGGRAMNQAADSVIAGNRELHASFSEASNVLAQASREMQESFREAAGTLAVVSRDLRETSDRLHDAATAPYEISIKRKGEPK